MSVPVALVCIAIAVVGSTIQSSIGLGFGLLSSPILVIVDTDFVPVAVLIAVLPLSAGVAVMNLGDIDVRGGGLALAGRVPGVVLGAVTVAAVSPRVLAIGLGLSVLVAVALSLQLPHFRVRFRHLVVAGALSGFMGTATGTGGPPMAIVYQRSDPRQVRATLAAFFAIGTVFSLVALIATGDIGGHQIELGVLLLPGVVLGMIASRWARPYLDGPRFRPILLGLCTASAIALLVKQI